MKTPKEIYLREWWWSPQPFWNYLDEAGRGWATMVDTHPGAFNLAWVSAGAGNPPQDYAQHAPKVLWALTESRYIPMGGLTMADWALKLRLAEFHAKLVEEARLLRRWQFHDKDMSYDRLLKAVASACKVRSA